MRHACSSTLQIQKDATGWQILYGLKMSHTKTRTLPCWPAKTTTTPQPSPLWPGISSHGWLCGWNLTKFWCFILFFAQVDFWHYLKNLWNTIFLSHFIVSMLLFERERERYLAFFVCCLKLVIWPTFGLSVNTATSTSTRPKKA